MIRRIVGIWFFLFSLSVFAGDCGQAVPTDDALFCTSFKMIAECHCTSKGLPRPACTNMKKIYERMTILYGSLQNACEAQHYTSTQTCIDDWNCYLHGGINSQGALCSGTGRACE